MFICAVFGCVLYTYLPRVAELLELVLDSWKSGRHSKLKVSSLKVREMSSSSSISLISSPHRGLSNTISPAEGNGLNGFGLSTMVLGHGTASTGSLIRLEREEEQVQITKLINKESTKQYKHHTLICHAKWHRYHKGSTTAHSTNQDSAITIRHDLIHG